MKKVICVDAKGLPELTNGKEYEVKNDLDDQYYIENDNGRYGPYFHYRFRLVPEAEFQYGQQVEYNGGGKWEKGIYCCPAPSDNHLHLVEIKGVAIYYVLLSDIRPIQSVRDKVVAKLKQTGFSTYNITLEDIADRIIELVKNETI